MQSIFASNLDFAKLKTPCYLLNIDDINNRYRQILDALEKYHSNVKIAYSYKTNSLSVITKNLYSLKSFAEVVSGQELSYALEDGFKANEIIFNGSVKLNSEIMPAIEHNVTIQVDSIDELKRIIKFAARLNKLPNLGIRLAHKLNGLNSRFGIQENEYIDCINLLRKHDIKIAGLHMHCGSNITSVKQYINNFERFITFRDKLSYKKFDYINIGGGFPANSSGEKIDYDKFFREIIKYLKASNLLNDNTILIIEPGRSLVEDFGYLISRVLFQKEINNQKLLITDTSITQMSSVRFWQHEVTFSGKRKNRTEQSYDVYGFNCFESDIIGKNIKSEFIPEYVIINNCGGYDIPSNSIWTRSLPFVYIIKKGRLFLIKNSKSHKNLYRSSFSNIKKLIK